MVKLAPAVIDVADWKGVERRKGRRRGERRKVLELVDFVTWEEPSEGWRRRRETS